MDKLKEKRERLGLSQVEMAKLVGVHLNTYSLWERGAGQPNDENKEKLKDILRDLEGSA